MFVCKMCGNCCRNLRGRLSKESARIIRWRYIYGLVEPLQKTINLFEWEVERLRTLGSNLGIIVKISPDLVFYDEISKSCIAFGWNLEHSNCPFLSTENKCIIYSKRPLICQAFPLFTTGILDYIKGQFIRLDLGDCPNKVSLPTGKQTVQGFIKKLLNAYGNSAVSAFRIDIAAYTLNTIMRDLSKNNDIAMAKMSRGVTRRIRNKTPIGFFDFIKMKNIISERELEDYIKEIETANLKLSNFL